MLGDKEKKTCFSRTNHKGGPGKGDTELPENPSQLQNEQLKGLESLEASPWCQL